MNKAMKISAIILIIILISVAVISGLIHGMMRLVALDATNAEVYETNNIDDYGSIIGNCDNDAPKEFITSFFPEKISETFSDLRYHYKAKKFDTYAYEAYLEFVIEDPVGFETYLRDNPNTTQAVPFSYDESYMICDFSRTMDLRRPAKENGAYAIEYAKVGCILYNTEEQRIIYFALGVYDGGGTDTSELNYFFNRFGIHFSD